jgi:hypothetical protein
MQGMMDQMMGGMTLWTIIGVLFVVLLVVVNRTAGSQVTGF